MCLQITGNTDRYSRVTQYFTYPVITRELALNPISFNQRISLRVNLYGQPLANFNRTVMRFHFYKHWNIYIYQLLFDRRVVLTKFGLGFVQVFYLFLKSLYVLGFFLSFLDSNRFLGCFLDPYGVFVEESSVLSDEDCKATCQISHQFYSYYETQGNNCISPLCKFIFSQTFVEKVFAVIFYRLFYWIFLIHNQNYTKMFVYVFLKI